MLNLTIVPMNNDVLTRDLEPVSYLGAPPGPAPPRLAPPAHQRRRFPLGCLPHRGADMAPSSATGATTESGKFAL